MHVFLETDRLILRRFTEDDAGLLLTLDSDPDVMRYIGPHALPDVPAYRQLIRDRWLPYYARFDDYGFWAVLNKESGEFLGWFHLRPALDYRYAAEAGFEEGDVDLGYRFVRAAWGEGLATEGARAIVRNTLDRTDTKRIVAVALAGNTASIRVMEKVGMRRVGEFAIAGYEMPAVKYALSRDEHQIV